MKIIAVLNREGGTFRPMDIEEFCTQARDVFKRHGHEIDCRSTSAKEIVAALEQAVTEGDCDVLMAGGGDGTVSAAADIAWKSDTTLAVLPAGTMNLFARSLKVPLVLSDALEALASGEIRNVDIATANGRPFVHQYAIGFHPRMVRVRKNFRYGSRLGKILASARAIRTVIKDPPSFPVELTIGGKAMLRNVSAVAISNNPYGDAPLPYAPDLETGYLGVYITAPLASQGYMRLMADIMLGRWRSNRDIEEFTAKEVGLRFPRLRKKANAVIDGELVPLKDDIVEIVIHPGSLKVLVPKSELPEAA
ncbi:diacylglycerol kinase family lipid kinase [Phyllobacterium salinisoli]|uniref:Diacylglycerol kinase family lipid kinase n=1 Tax=Phyllobacterium salinisoli TaxID=1899321 RepID=A0A368K2Y3_9HYPH|nr:diacylglycerol kinase family protein [Phyllobacterium salinisoli]RCS23748.1 diacylglycerol kinase family lipid kinase [Phyllobacterium salinisoli]